MSKYIIGIDPDLKKSGFAVSHGGNISKLWCLSMPEIYEYLSINHADIKRVYVEAGWLNKKVNWHNSKNNLTRQANAYDVGQNHASGKLIEDFLIHLRIDYVLVRPTEKKKNHDDFCILAKWDKGIPTNQEKRDAAMLILGYK